MNLENSVEFKGFIDIKNYYDRKVAITYFFKLSFIVYSILFAFSKSTLFTNLNLINILLMITKRLIYISVLALIISILTNLLISFMLKKSYYNSCRDKLHIYTISDKGIQVKKDNTLLLIKFSDIKEIVQYQDLYYIYIRYKVYNTKINYFSNTFIISQRFFENKHDEELFRNILKKNNISIENLKILKRAY